jgi:hypothetical protein
MKKNIIILMAILLAVACTPTAEPATSPPDTAVTSPPVIDATPQASDTQIAPSFAPLPSDGNLQRGSVFISASELLIRESFPVQIALVLSGETPTPCHQLRVVVNRPDTENKILVDAYTVSNPNVNCTQVVKPFQEIVEVGTFPTGHYTVWVNDIQVGEFDS